MKKTKHFKQILLLAAAMLGLAAGAQAQTFAPIGATWHYTYQEALANGFVKIFAEKDTVIENANCVKLVKTRKIFSHSSGEIYEIPLGNEYMTQKGDSVMIYRNGIFYKLFDFSANIGDSWTIPQTYASCIDTTGTITVVGRGDDLVNDISVRYIEIVDDSNSMWGYGNDVIGGRSNVVRILEGIGPIDSYLLPEQKCDFDHSEGGPLRCYSDSGIGSVNYSSTECDFIFTDLTEKETNKDIIIYPNPTYNKTTIILSTAENTISIYNSLGITVLSFKTNSALVELDLSILTEGMYFISIYNHFNIKKVLKIILLK